MFHTKTRSSGIAALAALSIAAGCNNEQPTVAELSQKDRISQKLTHLLDKEYKINFRTQGDGELLRKLRQGLPDEKMREAFDGMVVIEGSIYRRTEGFEVRIDSSPGLSEGNHISHFYSASGVHQHSLDSTGGGFGRLTWSDGSELILQLSPKDIVD